MSAFDWNLIAASRRNAGAIAHHAGLSAEDGVERAYVSNGYAMRARRWRRRGIGEIDLVAERDGALAFVEVKKSATHDRAAMSLGARQAARLMASAEAYLAENDLDQATELRFDVALVDGQGRIEILENALFDTV